MTKNAVTYETNKVVDHFYKHVNAFSHQKARIKNPEGKRAEKSFKLHVEYRRSIDLSKSSKSVLIK